MDVLTSNTPQGVVENGGPVEVIDLRNDGVGLISKQPQVVDQGSGVVAVGHRSMAGSEGQGVEGQHLIAATNGVAAPAVEVKSKSTGNPKGKLPKLINPAGWPSLFGNEVVSAVSPYWLVLTIPVAAAVGNADEVAEVHEFAIGLDTLAKSEAVGVVEKFGIADGTAEVMMRVNLPEDFPSNPSNDDHVGLVNSVIDKVRPYLANAAVMKLGTGRNRAAWAFKLNNNAIAP